MLDAIYFSKILVCLEGRTNPENKISYICEFSRCRLNVRLSTCIQTVATKVTNIGYRLSLGASVLTAVNQNSYSFGLE